MCPGGRAVAGPAVRCLGSPGLAEGQVDLGQIDPRLSSTVDLGLAVVDPVVLRLDSIGQVGLDNLCRVSLGPAGCQVRLDLVDLCLVNLCLVDLCLVNLCLVNLRLVNLRLVRGVDLGLAVLRLDSPGLGGRPAGQDLTDLCRVSRGAGLDLAALHPTVPGRVVPGRVVPGRV